MSKGKHSEAQITLKGHASSCPTRPTAAVRCSGTTRNCPAAARVLSAVRSRVRWSKTQKLCQSKLEIRDKESFG